MTLFNLVTRSMRKNIKHYYLYFFALILSVVLYFVFATLQHDSAVIAETNRSMNMSAGFQVAGILLIFIAGIFVIYANAIFLRRRSREIGLYQLIGLTKGAVARLLIIENALLSAGALLVGVGIGILLSRLFLLLLMKLVDFDGFIELNFSVAAILQTIFVFAAIIALTSFQMVARVYRSTLLSLFKADKSEEHPKQPKSFLSAFLGCLGIVFIAFGYWYSGHMLNALLFLNMLIVLATTISGTYLVFRVSISWLLYKLRVSKNGHLGLYNSLSIASIMHRMRGNANSLTIIAVLSAMTLTMVAVACSFYYSTEKDAKQIMPFHYMVLLGKDEDKDHQVDQFLQELDSEGIGYTASTVESLYITGEIMGDDFPTWLNGSTYFSIVSEEQLREAGLAVQAPAAGQGTVYDASLAWILKSVKTPYEVKLLDGPKEFSIKIEQLGDGNVINFPSPGTQIVVPDLVFNEVRDMIQGSEVETFTFRTINIKEDQDLDKAYDISRQDKYTAFSFSYYEMYKQNVQNNGLTIFIAGFLGLIFLLTTGSILYFKQMTEAEQEKNNYATLRQLGFTSKEIMRGIVKKQVFVFGLPLLIGLLHSIFAVKSASFMFMSDITLPVTISMTLYVVIYLIFAFLTVGYYRKIVKAAL
ncbi:bacitracin transport system permease protein [Sporosarcina luteola]|nr:bacitracin transport system permease protein [Sporosarcina luteola]